MKAPDESWARAVLDRELREFLLGASQYAVQFGRDEVMAWRPNKRFKGFEYDAAIEFVCGVLDRLPEAALRRFADDPGRLPYAEPAESGGAKT